MDKPEIDFPDFDPPADLQVTDITEGDGPEAASGQTVKVDGQELLVMREEDIMAVLVK